MSSSTILKQLHKERKPLLTALFLLGALIFLRFVVFPPNGPGYGKTSSLPAQKTFDLGGTTLLKGYAPLAFADEIPTEPSNAREIAFLLGARSALVSGEPPF